MKCPCCGNDLKIKDRVYMWLDSYGDNAEAKTLCCGKLVMINKITDYEIFESDSGNSTDNWGD